MDKKVSHRLEILSAWCGLAFVIGLVIFFGYFGNNLPNPPSPNLSATELHAFITTNYGEMRFGWAVALVIMGLYMPWSAQVSTQMARIEKHSRTMTYLQLIGGTLTVFVVSFGILCFAVATFRPDRSPEIVQVLTDIGWLSFELQWVLTTMQMVAMALVGLADKREVPLFPRWLCFLSFWCGVSFAPASLTLYLKTGPFAWDGLLGWYIPWAAWLVWCSAISMYMVKDIRRGETTNPAITGKLATS